MWSMLKINFIISDVNVFRNVKKVTVHVLFMPLLQYSPLAAALRDPSGGPVTLLSVGLLFIRFLLYYI